jgi:pyridoxal phosphate enzyme (YggS family)
MAVADNLGLVRSLIARAACKAGRDPEGVRIVAVTKGVGSVAIAEAMAAGQHDFGESRVQEALTKIPSFPEAIWHLVGHLQTNKARQAVQCFALLHSLDRMALARELDRHAGRAGRKVGTLVQVNVTGEPGKWGVAPADLPQFLTELSSLEHLQVSGLMTIGPLAGDPRPTFARLRELREQARVRGHSSMDLEWLSMGMSDDYPAAVEEGANLVRLGRAIFGPRREEDRACAVDGSIVS